MDASIILFWYRYTYHLLHTTYDINIADKYGSVKGKKQSLEGNKTKRECAALLVQKHNPQWNNIKDSFAIRKTYVFLDEAQEIKGWEKVVNSLMSDFDVDLYITGSNSRMMSSEI